MEKVRGLGEWIIAWNIVKYYGILKILWNCRHYKAIHKYEDISDIIVNEKVK